MALAGLYVYCEPKMGRDTGEQSGHGPVGITATGFPSDR
jgi:hypothetical protein